MSVCVDGCCGEYLSVNISVFGKGCASLHAGACGPGRRSTRVMLGYACETLAVMSRSRSRSRTIYFSNISQRKMNNSSQTSFTQHPSADPTEGYAFYAFYALGFIFRNWGPLQKVLIMISEARSLSNGSQNLLSPSPPANPARQTLILRVGDSPQQPSPYEG